MSQFCKKNSILIFFKVKCDFRDIFLRFDGLLDLIICYISLKVVRMGGGNRTGLFCVLLKYKPLEQSFVTISSLIHSISPLGIISPLKAIDFDDFPLGTITPFWENFPYSKKFPSEFGSLTKLNYILTIFFSIHSIISYLLNLFLFVLSFLERSLFSSFQ